MTSSASASGAAAEELELSRIDILPHAEEGQDDECTGAHGAAGSGGRRRDALASNNTSTFENDVISTLDARFSWALSSQQSASQMLSPTSLSPESPLLLEMEGSGPVRAGEFGMEESREQQQQQQQPFMVSSWKKFLDSCRQFQWKRWLASWIQFIGPGYMICIGYMDPGNWATDLAAGSTFGYTNLFVIFFSNIIAVFLQYQAVNLGVCSGKDLAEHCREQLPQIPSMILYALAEAAMIATDLAEVVGSAIALNLLFGIPLIFGVLITALDVFVLLMVFSKNRLEDESKVSPVIQGIILCLIVVIGVCFIFELHATGPVAADVFWGFLPSTQLITNSESLYFSIGILGATVMPHNLYLHSYLVKGSHTAPSSTPASSSSSSSSTSSSSSSSPACVQQATVPNQSLENLPSASSQRISFDSSDGIQGHPKQAEISEKKSIEATDPSEGDDGAVTFNAIALATLVSEPISVVNNDGNINNNCGDESSTLPIAAAEPSPFAPLPMLTSQSDTHSQEAAHKTKARRMGLVDTLVSLTLALFVNSAILIVASAAFFYQTNVPIASIQDAYNLLRSDLGPVSATIFAIGLLAAGQSSTLTGTVAGKAVMDGFIRYNMPPWVRRVVSRLIAILPAIAVIVVQGPESVDNLLIWSQVVLSLQLPFAVIPLVYFTSSRHIMKGHVNPLWMTAVGYAIGFLILALNIYYLSVGSS